MSTGTLSRAERAQAHRRPYRSDAAESVIAEGAGSNDLAVTARGEVYSTEPAARRIWLANAKGTKRVVDHGISFPNGIHFFARSSRYFLRYI
jgi:sugar lactone lactonase YvrE